MMKRSVLIAVGVAIVILTSYFTFRKNETSSAADILSAVKRGSFRIEIETTGELEAKSSVKILGPTKLRDFRIWEITIQSIIDEGTVVKKGDWIATLDRSEFHTRFSEKETEIEKVNSKFVQTQLDTTLDMRQTRDELANLKYGVEEKVIVLEQSKYEPPATIKQAEINLEKARRSYEQELENYKIKRSQSIEKMREVSGELRKVRGELDAMHNIMTSFDVLAPEDGMVIYERGWDGKSIKAGSRINMWEPTVARLPDLTHMMSRTYVNEVDVRKVKPGQLVEIGLDAYPDKRLTGRVIRVANVGEQRPNSDAKVFEVAVEINGTDMSLRPSMTTSNNIVTQVMDSVLFIPLECLHNQHDSITYVFVRAGLNTVKKEVMVGQTNANEVVVLGGLAEKEQVYLSVPPGQEDEEVTLLPELNGKRLKKNGRSQRSKEVAEAGSNH
jgi:multidrug efflux pump subunit AcrA (membrane-fusion protein)